MQLQLPFPAPFHSEKISHKDKIFIIGSCFAENIGLKLKDTKFEALVNPHGIVFSPLAVVRSLEDCLHKNVYRQEDLIYQDELWHGLNFHTDFSAPEAETALKKINRSMESAHESLCQADWLLVTAGTAFQYYYLQNNGKKIPVANCHKIPAVHFEKQLLQIAEIVHRLKLIVADVRQINPHLKIIWTVSPVRHIRDGLTENNRSKARLIEALRQLADDVTNSWYFPSYEILIDVLRDYRFFDCDLVHPSPLATEIIWQQFGRQFFTPMTTALVEEIQKIRIAAHHKPRFPERADHQKFLENIGQKITVLTHQHPELDFSEEQELLGHVSPTLQLCRLDA